MAFAAGGCYRVVAALEKGARVLDLNDFFYFVQVVDRGGFSAASRKLRIPKSTLSHRMQELETNLGVRLLNRTSRRFGMTEAGSEFHRHAVSMLQQAEHAETAMRQRLAEPVGTVRFTAAVGTAQFAMRDLVADFLVRYPKINVIAHATDRAIDIVGENFDVAIRAHSVPLPDSTLLQRPLATAPWFLFAGSAYVDAHGSPETPQDLAKWPSLCVMRTGVAPTWRLRHSSDPGDEVVVHLTPRILSDDMVGLKQAAIAGVGIVALPAYVCRDEVRSGALRRVLPTWLAGEAMLTALIPHRQGVLPCVRVFIAHLAAELPKAVVL